MVIQEAGFRIQDLEARGEKTFLMKKINKEGFFEAVFEDLSKPFKYKLRVVTHHDETREFYDPYSFPPVLTDFDLYLIGEGTHYKNYEKLGAHVKTVDGVKGVHFAVWAPNAKRVSVIGDFNRWDGRRHPMRMLGSSGIWEIFIPGLEEGNLYKFEIRSKYHKYIEQKADPFAFFYEVRPKSAAVVYSIENRHAWQDKEWMEQRKRKNWFESPVAIY